jgi:mannobiose 2-epimerase
MEELLKENLLDAWYPASVDTEHGGFLSDLSYDWKPEGSQDKTLVTQARHIWTCSKAAHFFNNPTYKKLAEYGYHALRDHMWDSTYGGFYSNTNQEWSIPKNEDKLEKTAYGHAFTIYALASYFHVSGDSAALNLARETFHWLEKHSYDPINKGYFDILLQDGTKKIESVNHGQGNTIDRAGWKDMNSSIHLLEAYSELYKVWQDSLVRERLEEMFYLVRDTIIRPDGFMDLHFTHDWQPISFADSSKAFILDNFFYDHVSFGHDIETVFLLLEASHVLGFENDITTLHICKKVVDHSLATGWDTKKGGFYYGGYYFKGSDDISIEDDNKQWWVQAEGLNTLLLMSKLFSEDPLYLKMFIKQWKYIDTYLIDYENGGWYHAGLDVNPEGKKDPKANIWKVNYHTMRSLMNCIKMLRDKYELISPQI